MSKRSTQVCIDLPKWFDPTRTPLDFPAQDRDQAMRLAIDLSRQNVVHQTGGPFAALVVQMDQGKVVSAAVNCVEAQCCSSAHAEIMALSLAQQALNTWNLADTPHSPLTLVTSCEPCAMCLGAIPWSGVAEVICGATKDDAERAGFDEGARSLDWIEALKERNINVVTGIAREQAASVLMEYAQSGQTIYNP